MARRRGYGGTRTPSRRKVRWIRNANELGGTGHANFGWDLLNSSGAGLTYKDFVGATVMRTHIRFMVEKNFATYGSRIICGLHVGKAQLNPDTDSPHLLDRNAFDWMMYDDMFGVPATVETPGFARAVASTGTDLWVKEWDVKAKRKLEEMSSTLWFTYRDLQPTPVSQGAIVSAVLLAMP